MSAAPEPVAPQVEAPESWPVFTPPQRRVLGVLIEKAKTTPDTYPLSLNSLVTGCNQKSNRDPVVNLAEGDVEEALLELQKLRLVARVLPGGGSRVERWKHLLYDTWRVDKVEIAVLAELLLRGAQTEGELRGRAGRMEPIEDLEKLRAILKPLAQRRLVVYLTPEGRRGTTVTHGFQAPRDLERLRASIVLEPETAPEPRPAPAADVPLPPPPPQAAALEAEVADLRARVAELQKTVNTLAEELRILKSSLGV